MRARNGDKTMHNFEHLISNKALRLLEQVGIREHKSCCAPVNDRGQMVLPKEKLVEIAKGDLP